VKYRQAFDEYPGASKSGTLSNGASVFRRRSNEDILPIPNLTGPPADFKSVSVAHENLATFLFGFPPTSYDNPRTLLSERYRQLVLDGGRSWGGGGPYARQLHPSAWWPRGANRAGLRSTTLRRDRCRCQYPPRCEDIETKLLIRTLWAKLCPRQTSIFLLRKSQQKPVFRRFLLPGDGIG